MSVPIKVITVTEITVPDGGTTVTEALPRNLKREHLLVKYEGSAFYVGYGPAVPTGTSAQIKAAMTLVDGTNFNGDFWDAGGMPKTKVFLYQDIGGGNITVKVREGE
jgi:hypothetical protein